MPNWCYNTTTIRGSKEDIDKFEAFLTERNGENWFDYFAPTPKELENEGWYEWNVSNWGTKWNVTCYQWERLNEESIHMVYDTAWSPPINLYDTIQSTGLTVESEYCEEGMGFVGQYIDGIDECYEYSDVEDLDNIPDHLVENWNLHDNFESWDEEDENEEEK